MLPSGMAMTAVQRQDEAGSGPCRKFGVREEKWNASRPKTLDGEKKGAERKLWTMMNDSGT